MKATLHNINTTEEFEAMLNAAIVHHKKYYKQIEAFVISAGLFYKMANKGFKFYGHQIRNEPCNYRGVPIMRTSDISDDHTIYVVTD